MSTFLELCQAVAQESGTVSNIGQPETTTGQTGRLLRIMGWVTDAYKDIQRRQNAWRWLHRDFSGETIIGVGDYNASAMGISERFSRWVFSCDGVDNLFTIYETAAGQADEGFLTFKDWGDFRRNMLVGANATETGSPIYVTVDPQNKLRLWPIPDGEYTVRGMYYQAPQVLAIDGDVPEMPEQFHDLIKWAALRKLGMFDEAFEQLPSWTAEYSRIMGELNGNQLPRIKLGGTLA